MINYTTPAIELTVEDEDLTGMDVYVTLQQRSVVLTKTGNDLVIETETVGQVTNTNITLTLSQEESAAFKYNQPVALQVNWIASNGVRDATDIQNIPVMQNLLDEVITYGA